MVFKKKSEIYSSKTVKHILKYFSRPVHFYMINYFLKLSRRLSACWMWAIKILYAKSERGWLIKLLPCRNYPDVLHKYEEIANVFFFQLFFFLLVWLMFPFGNISPLRSWKHDNRAMPLGRVWIIVMKSARLSTWCEFICLLDGWCEIYDAPNCSSPCL